MLIPAAALLYVAVAVTIVVGATLGAMLVKAGVALVMSIVTVNVPLLGPAVRIAVRGPRYFANWNEKGRR